VFIAFIFILAGFGYKIVFLPVPHVVARCLSGRADPIHRVSFSGVQCRGLGDHDPLLFPGMSQVLASGDWTFIAGVEWPQVLLALSILTMTIGNLCALNQRNLKRMLAYSGIAHAGYMMMGLAILNNEGLAAILFYAVVYMIMNVGAFLVVGMIANVTGDEDIEDYRGSPGAAPLCRRFVLAIFLFSLTGRPPFAGFVGKFFCFPRS
jgi:NADH-quinone oxidoreductase subunit N